MPKQVITNSDGHFLETEDKTLVPISREESHKITAFNNVEEIPLGGQVIGDGKYFESDSGHISKIIPADN